MDELTDQQKAELEAAAQVNANEQAAAISATTNQRSDLPPLAEREAAAAAENRALNEGIRDNISSSNAPHASIIVPDVVIPKDAIPHDINEQGQPSYFEKDGEKYYPSGTTPHSMGIRTESENIQAQAYGTQNGPHAGDFTEPTVVLVKDGQPVARWTQSQIDASHREGGYAGGDIDQFIKAGEYMVPVKNADGKEVLLTPKQYDRLTTNPGTPDQLDVAKTLKLVPPDMTLKDFNANRESQQAKVAASDFEVAQFKKNNTKLSDGNYISNADLKDLTMKASGDETTKRYLNILLAKDGGFDAAKRFVEDENARIAVQNADIALANSRAETQKTALAKLQPYTTQEWGAGPPIPAKVVEVNGVRKLTGGESAKVDILAFIHDNPKDAEQTLIDAKYKPEDVKTWVAQVQSPIYLNSLFDTKVNEVRNELLKTAKPKLGESTDTADFYNRISGEAGAQVAKQFSKDEMSAILKEKGIQGANADAQMVLLGAGTVGAIPWKVAALASGLASGGVTATHWAYLSTPEKVIAVSEDVAGTLLMMYGDKLLKMPVLTKGGLNIAEGVGQGISKTASGIAKIERYAANAGKAGGQLAYDLTKAAQAADKVAIATKPIKVAASEAGKAAELANKADLSAVNKQPGYVSRLISTTSGEPIDLTFVTAKEQTAIKASEAVSRKADEIFLSKLSKVRSLNPVQLADLEKRSGIKGLAESIKDVRTSVDYLQNAWKEVDRAKLYPNPKNAGQIAANVRHIQKLENVTLRQSELQDALDVAGSTLQPRYKKFDVDTIYWQNKLLDKINHASDWQISTPEREKSLAILRSLERQTQSNFTSTISGSQSEMGLGGEMVDYGGTSKSTKGLASRLTIQGQGKNIAKVIDTQRTFEQLKYLRDAKILTDEEYQTYLKYIERQTKIPYAKYKVDITKAKLNASESTLKNLDDLMGGTPGKSSPETEAKVRESLSKSSRESRAKYEAQVKADTETARTAVAEREKVAQEIRKAQQVPVPKVEPKEGLRASDLPKVQTIGQPQPFRLPTTKKQTELMPSRQTTQQEGIDASRMASGRREFTSPLEDVRSSPVIRTLAKTGEFTRLNPKEWEQVREQVNAGIQAQQKAQASGATQEQVNNQIRESVQNKAREQLSQQPATRAQEQTQTQLITKTIVEQKTPIRPPPPPPPPPFKIKRPPFIPRFSSPQEIDAEKRAYIKESPESAAWPQGELGRFDKQTVWHVVIGPYNKPQHLIVRGEKPEGAQIFHGPKEAYRSITQLSGRPPVNPVRLGRGGIADPVIFTRKGKLAITFVSNKPRRRTSKPRLAQARQSDIAPDLVESRHGGKRMRRARLF